MCVCVHVIVVGFKSRKFTLSHQMSKDMYAHVHKYNAHYKRIRNAGSISMPPIYRGVK